MDVNGRASFSFPPPPLTALRQKKGTPTTPTVVVLTAAAASAPSRLCAGSPVVAAPLSTQMPDRCENSGGRDRKGAPTPLGGGGEAGKRSRLGGLCRMWFGVNGDE